MALQVVANTIEAMRNDQREQPIYPVWGCNCGKEGAVLVEGCLDYERTGPQSYSIAKLYCTACQGAGIVKEQHLPAEFFLRVRESSKDFGDATTNREPRFGGYFVTGVIQYNKRGKHFRYVRIDFSRGTVIGVNPNDKNKETGLKEEFLNAAGWSNYVYCYSIGQKGTVTRYEGEQPVMLEPGNYSQGTFGGSSEWRAVHWNVQSMTQKKIAAKKRVLKGYKPLLILVNENWKEF